MKTSEEKMRFEGCCCHTTLDTLEEGGEILDNELRHINLDVEKMIEENNIDLLCKTKDMHSNEDCKVHAFTKEGQNCIRQRQWKKKQRDDHLNLKLKVVLLY